MSNTTSKETVLLKFYVRSDKIALSELEMDYRGGIDDMGMVAWKALPGGALWALSNHEFVIRNDDGMVSVIRREKEK